jgi:hypothetical protein
MKRFLAFPGFVAALGAIGGGRAESGDPGALLTQAAAAAALGEPVKSGGPAITCHGEDSKIDCCRMGLRYEASPEKVADLLKTVVGRVAE